MWSPLHYDLLCRCDAAFRKARGEPVVLFKFTSHHQKFPDLMLAFPSGLKATIVATTRTCYSAEGEATACQALLGPRAAEIAAQIDMLALSASARAG